MEPASRVREILQSEIHVNEDDDQEMDLDSDMVMRLFSRLKCYGYFSRTFPWINIENIKFGVVKHCIKLCKF